jgi:CDP-diacylglycerol--serine O-phosphatidyltransferase
MYEGGNMQELLFVLAVSLSLAGVLVYLAKALLPKQAVKDFIYNNQLFFHPNSICYERVVIVIIAFIIYGLGWQYLGIALFLLGAFLDAVDGMVARACGLVTEKGKQLDPFCDKLSYLIPLVYFCIGGMLPASIMATFIIVELMGQWLVRSILSGLGWSVAANNFGKVKAVLSFSLVPYLFILQNNAILPNLSEHILTISLGLSICSAIFKLIPNKFYADILSLLNLVCGAISLYLIGKGNLIGATLAVVLGQVFDLFDGRMAIKHGGTKIGPWLDDIADFVSFGISPMILILVVVQDGIVLQIIAGGYLLAITYRLIRFIWIDKKKADFNPAIFNGLPSPAAAILVFGICLLNLPLLVITPAVLIVSLLAVSNLPFVHFGKGIVKQLPRGTVVISGAGLFVLFAYFVKINSSMGVGFSLLAGMLLYFILGEVSRRKILF